MVVPIVSRLVPMFGGWISSSSSPNLNLQYLHQVQWQINPTQRRIQSSTILGLDSSTLTPQQTCKLELKLYVHNQIIIKNSKTEGEKSRKKEGTKYHLWHLYLFGAACWHALSSSTQTQLPPVPKVLPSRRKQLPQVAHCVPISAYNRLLGKHTQRASMWTQI